MSPEPCTTLRCEADAWAQRATVAKWAAEELDACGQAVARVLSNNYFGDGCVEAPPIFRQLAEAVSTGSASWRVKVICQATAMNALATACSGGEWSLMADDQVGAQAIEQ